MAFKRSPVRSRSGPPVRQGVTGNRNPLFVSGQCSVLGDTDGVPVWHGLDDSRMTAPGDDHASPITFSSSPSHSAMRPTFRTTSGHVRPLHASTRRARNLFTAS
jgi:hypothetical protein